MAKIIGNTTATPNPQSDWKQTDETKADYIKNKPDMQSFSNALKGCATGAAVSLNDVSPIEHDITVTVIGKNKMNFGLSADHVEEKNGLTCTFKTDNTIVLNGTPTVNSSFSLNLSIPIEIENKKTYTISINDENQNRAYYAVLRETNELYYSVSNNTTFTAQTDSIINIAIVVIANNTFDNHVIQLQLEEGTAATEYVPNVPDISAVKLIKQGKNLFDMSKLKTTNYPGSCCVSSIGADYIEITTPATYSGNGYCNTSVQLGKLCPTLKEGDLATLSFVTDNASAFNFFYFNSAGKWENGKSKTITQSMLNDNLTVYGGATANDVTKISNIQVEVGNVTEYESYIEPIEYAVNADSSVTGVNSIYPSTTLLTDTNGAIISAEYNKDINKVFQELYNAIISLGGNV